MHPPLLPPFSPSGLFVSTPQVVTLVRAVRTREGGVFGTSAAPARRLASLGALLVVAGELAMTLLGVWAFHVCSEVAT